MDALFKRERDRCGVNKLRLKTIFYITFLACNLLTRAKSPVRLAIGKSDSPRFSYIKLMLCECCDLSKVTH
ncbi:hypothetical protein B1J93_16340 [Leptospira kirschneri serovar Pomona]|uniref:Uncharacterized protein n=1 Tax=Leptospira kirschneri serovar Pomona TaxID=561005 RepID=A0A1T1DIK5_9LEPT|nr:hypothetical protein B1J93_16340 [Leptospira kirschneri serovar Pomona]